MLAFGVAKELGYTLQELYEKITFEELLGWSAYFGILNDQMEKQMKQR